MTQLGFITVSGLVYLATRVTKLLLESKLRKQEATLENVVIGVENYSLGRKSKNSNVKIAIANQIESEMPGLKKVIDKAISKVEGEGPKRGILQILSNIVFKIINILL